MMFGVSVLPCCQRLGASRRFLACVKPKFEDSPEGLCLTCEAPSRSEGSPKGFPRYTQIYETIQNIQINFVQPTRLNFFTNVLWLLRITPINLEFKRIKNQTFLQSEFIKFKAVYFYIFAGF